jgi:hypothetical protein
MIVGDLGSEEILLLATDSGNVAAYHTNAIQDAIEKEPYKFSQEGRSDLVGLRPFFSHWVYESAWGLSLHKHARMVAVSSNKPHHHLSMGVHAAITVFAFALTTSDDQGRRATSHELSEDDDSEWKFWIPDQAKPAVMPNRFANWKTRLEAHTVNIPSINFVNSDIDLNGEYMLSTDIDGITKSWHIWQGKVMHSWDFSSPMRRPANPILHTYQKS